MKQEQAKTALTFDFTFKPVKTPRKTIRIEEPLEEFRILNFVNDNASICKIYFDNEDALKPFVNHLQPSTVYEVFSADNDAPFANILVFEKKGIVNYTVKATILNVEQRKIEKTNNNSLI